MSITTDSNIFTVEDYDALAALPVGTVVAELHDVGDQWLAEVRGDGKIRRIHTDPTWIEDYGTHGPEQKHGVLVLPVRVVNPEILASEAEITGIEPASIEGKCCGKYDPCPKAEPVVTVTVIEFQFGIIAPVGN